MKKLLKLAVAVLVPAMLLSLVAYLISKYYVLSIIRISTFGIVMLDFVLYALAASLGIFLWQRK